MPQPVIFFFAFLAVLALIGLVAWLVRRFAGNRLGANSNRGRMPRLAVIDAAAVDGRRRLVLVRRDNVEHLLMIGGPTDIVVEPNIVRAGPIREQMPPRQGSELPRPTSLDTGHWDGDTHADQHEPQLPPLPDLPPRAQRPSFAEEVRRSAPPAPFQDELRRPTPPIPPRNPDHMPGIMLDTISRPEPRPEPRMEPRESRIEPREPRMEPVPRAQPRPRPGMPAIPPPPPPAAPPKAPPQPAPRPGAAPAPPPSHP
ncbi:flagellar biosynthetic protein FliO, partial [Rhodopseudomonas sp. BAL398]|uniref:flagellar biosynthetic protein FliO n=1 Tax=Rhodopseudomonas sp. BAL398 TaxID=3034676 RepID=UPI0023E2BCC9